MEAEPAAASADGVRVAVRVRPLNERERTLVAFGHGGAAGLTWALTEQSMTQVVEQRPVQANSFAFDHVFLQGVNNETVYKSLAAPVVLSSVEGINGVIFAYGQTAAGKTHTMLGSDDDPGITRRSISELFSAIAGSRGRGFLLRASYIEIYNEVIMDLLSPGGEGLKIHEDVVNKRVYVNAKEEVVTSVQDVMDMLAAGEEARAVGVTNMNERSSRSHTIFTLRIESRELKATEAPDGSNEEEEDDGVAVRASTLTLVDLAGSERVAFTKAEGQRLKEGGHINKSLLTLGTVINKLSSGESRSAAHIPYRDSKLTRILQPALGGNARTAIVCAVTPSIVHMDETLSTLRFASRAKKVTNHAHANEFLDDRAKLRRAQKEIAKLKAENEAMRKSGADPDVATAAPTEASLALQDRKAQKRMRIFLQKFDKMVSEPRSARASAPGAGSSSDWRSPAKVPDTWHCRPMLRDALDLVGVPARRPSGAFDPPVKGAGDEGAEKGDADLRMRTLQAEKEVAQLQSEIECERKAMESEVVMLEAAADSAQRAQNNSAIELEQAMSLLATAQVTSLVDEIFEGACMISERDGKLNAAEKEIKRLEGVQAVLAETSAKFAVSEKSLGEALKREKRGVGPVIKEKMALQKKLVDVESKLKDVRQKLSTANTEKAGVERELKGEERKNKALAAEVEKHRKHKGMADARIAKGHEEEKKKMSDEFQDEKKKIVDELKAAKEKNIASNGIVAAQKSKIEEMQKQFGALSIAIATKGAALEEMEAGLAETTAQLEACKKELEEVSAKLKEAETENEVLKESNAAQAEKYEADMAVKAAALKTVGENMEKVREELGARLTEMQSEVDRLQEKLQTSEKIVVKEREASAAALKSAIEKKDKELKELQEKLQEREKTAVADRRASATALTNAIEEKDKELQALRAKLQASEETAVTDRRASASALQLAIQKKDKELEELGSTLSRTKSANEQTLADTKKVEEERNRLRGELQILESRQEETEKKIQEHRSSDENLRRKSGALQQEVQDLRRTLHETQTDLENCKGCCALNGELQTLKREVGEGLAHSTRGVKAAGQEFGRRANEMQAGMQRLLERNQALLAEQQMAAAEKLRTIASLTKEKARAHAAESQLAQERVGEGVVGALQRKLRRRDGTVARLNAALDKAEEGVEGQEGWGDARKVAELEADVRTADNEVKRLQRVEERLGEERLKLIDDAHRLRQKIKEREAVWTRSLHERREKDLLRLERIVEGFQR